MRVPNWLYNYGRLLVTASVLAGVAVATLVSPLFKLVIYFVMLTVGLAGLVTLVEVLRAAVRGGAAFDWWRK
mgnify:CR=1 FL=1